MPGPMPTDITAWMRNDKWSGHYWRPHSQRHLGHLRLRQFTLMTPRSHGWYFPAMAYTTLPNSNDAAMYIGVGAPAT